VENTYGIKPEVGNLNPTYAYCYSHTHRNECARDYQKANADASKAEFDIYYKALPSDAKKVRYLLLDIFSMLIMSPIPQVFAQRAKELVSSKLSSHCVQYSWSCTETDTINFIYYDERLQ
jgi:hypothetical protein